MIRSVQLTICCCLACSVIVCGGVTTAGENSAIRSRPIDLERLTSIKVFPNKVELRGRDSRQQIVVTGITSNKQQFDLTSAASFLSRDTDIANVTDRGILEPARRRPRS